MSVSSLKETPQYKEAIAATTDIGQGFSEKDSTSTLLTVSKQLNTLLYSVIRLRTEVEALKEEVRRAQIQVPAPELSELTRKLGELHLSPQGEAYKRERGTIKVYQNPFDLLKKISN